jgi:hydroxyethylthiazole kinase-like uncharacterized protein yjeF
VTLRPLPASDGHDGGLHHGAAARACEQLALQASVPQALMQAAGLAVAQLAQALCPHGRLAWLLVGPGNNGGDGLVAAVALQQAGWCVEVCLMPTSRPRPEDAQWALKQAQAAGLAMVPWPASPSTQPDLVIDALLGRGALRAPEGDMALALAAIRQWTDLGVPALAVDLPTGLCGDTGRTLTPLVVRATATLALLTCAPGLFTGQGRDCGGQIWWTALADEVVKTCPPTARLASAADWRQAVPPRQHAQHKGSFGDVWVVGGGPGMAGAAHLAARAALVAGAGRVFRCGLDGAGPEADPIWPELMQREPAAWQTTGVLESATVVCGCGGGTAVQAVLPAILARSARLVLDADALNALSRDLALLPLLQHRAARQRNTVLTPHPLEAARLLGCSVAQVQADRLSQAQALAEKFNAIVVLKGSGTVIAAPGQTPVINPSGSARLATPGSGDVLAGWLGGLWSQGADASLQAATGAAAAAVWSHGAAADQTGSAAQVRGPLTASALIVALQRFIALPH